MEKLLKIKWKLNNFFYILSLLIGEEWGSNERRGGEEEELSCAVRDNDAGNANNKQIGPIAWWGIANAGEGWKWTSGGTIWDSFWGWNLWTQQSRWTTAPRDEKQPKLMVGLDLG